MKKHLVVATAAFVLFSLGLPAAFGSTSLDQKLTLQWERYDKARQLLIQKAGNTFLPPDQRVISRSQWEEMIGLKGEQAFTKDDILALVRSQADRALQAKARAASSSVINLDRIRASRQTAQFCEKLPKGGMLHIHSWGTLDRKLATKLLQAANPMLDMKPVFEFIDQSQGNAMLYPPERQRLKQTFSNPMPYQSVTLPVRQGFESFLFLPPGKHPFPRFNAVFGFIDFAISSWNQLHEVILTFAQKAVQQGVFYVELTDGTYDPYPQHIAEIEAKTGLVIRANQAFQRTAPLAALDTAWNKLRARPKNKYVVGIDFLDNEDGNPAFEKGQLLYGAALAAAEKGATQLHRTMHSGEIGDLRNPRDSMIMGAERLGHGTNLWKDPVALEYAARIHEPIETNLSSNMRLTDVPSIRAHPFLHYLRLGLPVSLSTDDEGIFDTDINHECQLAIDQTDITYAEMKEMAFNSIRTSFASDPDKEALLVRLTAAFKKFETDNIRWR